MRARSLLILLSLLPFTLIGCVTTTKNNHQLQSGAYHFEQGYYKRAMHDLLPAAIDGNARAQYAIGYLYYYGYGVAQDRDTGYFWMARAANCGDPKAKKALQLIAEEKIIKVHAKKRKKTYRHYLP